MNKNFLFGIFTVFVCFVVLSAPSLWVQYKAGEMMNVKESASLQIKSSECLMQWATSGIQAKELKYEIIKQTKPDVLVTGPGTVNFFRDFFFKVPSYNMGHYISDASSGVQEIEALLDVYKPKLIIFVVNQWWFMKSDETGSKIINSIFGRWVSLFHKIYNPYIWLAQGKLDFETFKDIFFRDNPCPVGMRAIANKKHGFRKDGSWFAGRTYADSYAPDFASELKNVELMQNEFYLTDDLNMTNIKNLQSIVKKVKSVGSEIFIVVPPLAPTVHQAVTERVKPEEYYLNKAREKLSNNINFVFLDDPEMVGSVNCEYFNAYTYGEVVSARIIKELAHRNREIAKYVDLDTLESFIEENKGFFASHNIVKEMLEKHDMEVQDYCLN